jgi:hypothetical protein
MKKVWILMDHGFVLGAYSSEFKAERVMSKRYEEDEADDKTTYYTIEETEVDEE